MVEMYVGMWDGENCSNSQSQQSHSHIHSTCTPEKSDIRSKLVRLALNWTNLGIFKIRFQYLLMYWNLIFIKSQIFLIWCQSDQLWVQIWHLCCTPVRSKGRQLRQEVKMKRYYNQTSSHTLEGEKMMNSKYKTTIYKLNHKSLSDIDLSENPPWSRQDCQRIVYKFYQKTIKLPTGYVKINRDLF